MTFVRARHCSALVAVLALAGPASAEIVGSAVTVTPAAQTESARGAVILARGREVHAFDKVRTSVDGAVTLRFRDESMLDVGPGSVVTIDRFVYNPDNTARAAAITMTKGTFRWVSGRSAKEAYDLKTPATTLGIRGTDFTVIADLDSTVVQLKSGAVRACSPASGRCNEISRPGQGVRIWNDGRIQMFAPGTLMHAQVRRMAHHMRMPGLNRPPMPAGQTAAAAQQPAATAAGNVRQAGPLSGQRQVTAAAKLQWTGSYAPRDGLSSMPKTHAALPQTQPAGAVGMQNAALVRDHKIQMTKPIQGGLMPGGAQTRANQHIQKIPQPGLVERKGEANIPVIR